MQAQRTPHLKKGSILQYLFALPFCAVGVWMAGSIAHDLYSASQMQSWLPVEAILSEAGYRSHAGDGSATYEAYARYRYEFGGRRFEGDRVSVSRGADNLGSYQRRLGSELAAALARGDSVDIYVDPGEPANAVIDPAIRLPLIGFKMIFLLVFGGVGAALIGYAALRQRPSEPSAIAPAGLPWLANHAWQSATITSDARSSMRLAWAFAGFWNLVSAPLPFLIYEEFMTHGNSAALAGLVFPLVGAGVLIWAVRRTLEWHHFGPAPVVLDPFPGCLGGQVGGAVDLQRVFDPGARFTVTLTHLQGHGSPGEERHDRRETARWQDIQRAQVTRSPTGTRLQFSFDVPPGLDESSTGSGRGPVSRWRISITGNVAGANLDRSYEIPVFATGARCRQLAGQPMRASRVRQRQLDTEATGQFAKSGYGPTGPYLHYPAGRNLAPGVGGLVFGGFFAVSGYFLVTRQDAMLMGAVFILMGVLILLLGLYVLSNSLEIRKQGEDITTVRRILGVTVRRRRLSVRDFLRFSKSSTMSTQAGSKQVIFYTLFAHARDGRKLVVGEGFRGVGEADTAALLFAQHFGLEPAEDLASNAAPVDEQNLLAAD